MAERKNEWSYTEVTQLPSDEMRALPFYLQQDLPPMAPFTVLEFGNKKNSTGNYSEWYKEKGCLIYKCIDWNGKDGALPLDVNYSLCPDDIGYEADVVTNFGFSEHVTNQESFWRNNHNLCKLNGAMSGVTPAPGYWPKHGILQPTLEFYAAIAEANGYLPRIWQNAQRRRRTNCYHFVKKQEEFVWDDAWLDLITPTEAPTQQALRNSGL